MHVRSPPEVPIRTPAVAVAVATVLSAASSLRAEFRETHLNEITAPLASYATARVTVLAAMPSPSKAENKELKSLQALGKSLAKTAFSLKQDFAELAAAGAAFDKLGPAAAAMQPSLDQAMALANLSLGERVELVGDYQELLPATNPKHSAAVQKALAAVTSARAAAAAVSTPGKRAAALAKVNTAVIKALTKADRYVLADRQDGQVPPTRFRSGDAIGPGGGRIAIPRDSGSPLAGASIVIPSQVIPNQESVVVTLAPGTAFVGGRDVPAGPALAVGPDAHAFAAPVTVYLPYLLPDGANADDLALFAAGPPVSSVAPVDARADGTLAADVTALSTFQAGLAAPAPGQPGGAYHVQTFAVNTSLDPANQDLAGVLVGILDHTVTFRSNHTASTSPPAFPVVTRTFTSAVPHHTDTAQGPFLGSVDFTWTAGTTGRFSFTLPLGTGVDAAVTGVASDDGRVVAWTGRGGSFEFVAVGVKTDADTVTADLAGRWAAVEIGAQFADDGVEPFRTRWHDALRFFTVDAAGAVTFDPSGYRLETDITYATDQADPVHTRDRRVVTDGGSETWTIGVNGRLSGAGSARSGWFDGTAGLLTSAVYYDTTRRIALMVAVPQSAVSTPAALHGLYRFAGLDVGTSVGTPTTHDSTHEVTLSTGSLDFHADDNADLTEDPATEVSYLLTGAAPLPNIAWTMTSSPAAVAGGSTSFAMTLDAAGNRTGFPDERSIAFAGSGRFVLFVSNDSAPLYERGIALGVR
jgi:hypothetical protein